MGSWVIIPRILNLGTKWGVSQLHTQVALSPGRVSGAHRLGKGRRIYNARAQKGKRKDFLGTRHLLLSQFFIYFSRPASLNCEEHVYIQPYTYVIEYRLYLNYLCYKIILRVKHFYTNRSGAKCWLDIYNWGADLAVTGPIHDNGHEVLKSTFQTGSSSIAIYFHIFTLIAFLRDLYQKCNINIILWIIIQYNCNLH